MSINKYKKIIAKIVSGIFRAKDAGLMHLPKTIKSGANCLNCHYYMKTDSPDIGYCWKPEVSLFITEKQVCNHWAADGAIGYWNKTKLFLMRHFRDMPPPVTSDDVKINDRGGVKYVDKTEFDRARSAGLITLPTDVEGSRCYNCEYSSPVGWCKNPNVNLPIDKNDLCKHWHNPNSHP